MSLRVRLLIDIRTAFRDAERLLSETLVSRLREDPEAPWETLGKNGLNPKSLAGLLRDFGIHSVQDRWDGSQARGFKREQFQDSWNRYCPDPRSSRHLPVPAVTASHTPEIGTAEQPCDGSPVTKSPNRHKSTLMRRRDGWDGKTQQPETAVCITCRQPLSYDDGTHTHPTCEARS